jgi:hypothetical protein
MSYTSTSNNISSAPSSNTWYDIEVVADTNNEYRLVYLHSQKDSSRSTDPADSALHQYRLRREESVDTDNTIHDVHDPEDMERELLAAVEEYTNSPQHANEAWNIVGEVFDPRLVLTELEMPDWDRLHKDNMPSKAVLLEREGCQISNDNSSSDEVCDRGCKGTCNESFDDCYLYPLERQQAGGSGRLFASDGWEAWWKQREEQQLEEEEELEQQLRQEPEQERRCRSVSFRSVIGSGFRPGSERSLHTKKMLADQRGEGLVLRKANREAGTIREGWLKRWYRSITKIGTGPELEKKSRLAPAMKGRWHGRPIKA